MAQTVIDPVKSHGNRLLASLPGTLILNFCLAVECFAGPPLLTDDPGILDPGSWEVIAAISGERRSGDGVLQPPSLDVSAGLTDNTQFSVSLTYGVMESGIVLAEPGQETAALGYKWRIISESGWELALGANYALPVSPIATKDQEETRALGLPLIASYSWDEWAWHGLAGWCIESDGNRSFEYGLALSHPLIGSTRWMAEIVGTSSGFFRENSLGFNLGLDYEFNPVLHILASAGSRLNAGPDPAGTLELVFYIGLQWFR